MSLLKETKDLESKYYEYYKSKGIDLNDLTHPLAKEFYFVRKINNSQSTRCFEHFLMLLILSLEHIKRSNEDDYKYYIRRLLKKDISFWGERFEIFFNEILISKLNEDFTNFKRGNQVNEADFLLSFKDKIICIETTSVSYSQNSSKSNPISKIKQKISEKEKKEYAKTDCCLVVDISNLMFYRIIFDNFSVTIVELLKTLESNFGAIIIHYGEHTIDSNNEISYSSQVYTYYNPDIFSELKDFLTYSLSNEGFQENNKTIYFGH